MTSHPQSASTTVKLLNCPFCNSSSVYPELTQYNWPMIQCIDCGAQGPCIDIDEQKAVTRWNTRAAASPSPSAVAFRPPQVVCNHPADKQRGSGRVSCDGSGYSESVCTVCGWRFRSEWGPREVASAVPSENCGGGNA